MAIKYADRVRETSTTTGTGTINLAGATQGYQTFVGGVGSGAKTAYFIEDGQSWESGIGTVTAGSPDTLSRDRVIASSAGGSAINWGVGTRNVFIGASSEVLIWRDENGNDTNQIGLGGGTANAHTVTFPNKVSAYSNNMLIRWFAPATNTLAIQVKVNTLGNKAYKASPGVDFANGEVVAGTLQEAVYSAADDCFYDARIGSVTRTKMSPAAVPQIFTPTASVAANAMTLGFGASFLGFRASSLTSGVPSNVATVGATLTVPSGATMGAVSGQLTRYAILAIYNGTTVEAAAVNLAGGVNLSEEGVISTTALSGSSNSANVVYSTTARSNVPYRLMGIAEYTQTTAGTHASAHTLLVGAGGNALSAMSSFGYGQTSQTVTRSMNTTYYNTTGKPIECFVVIQGVSTDTYATVSLNGGTPTNFAAGNVNTGASICGGSFTVPAGQSYSVSGGNLISWRETR